MHAEGIVVKRSFLLANGETKIVVGTFMFSSRSHMWVVYFFPSLFTMFSSIFKYDIRCLVCYSKVGYRLICVRSEQKTFRFVEGNSCYPKKRKTYFFLDDYLVGPWTWILLDLSFQILPVTILSRNRPLWLRGAQCRMKC